MIGISSKTPATRDRKPGYIWATKAITPPLMLVTGKGPPDKRKVPTKRCSPTRSTPPRDGSDENTAQSQLLLALAEAHLQLPTIDDTPVADGEKSNRKSPGLPEHTLITSPLQETPFIFPFVRT